MKKLSAILLLLVFLILQITQGIIIIDFLINQDYIAENFCIEKNEPLSMCSGKCYLSQELSKVAIDYDKELPRQSQLEIPTSHLFIIKLTNLSDPRNLFIKESILNKEDHEYHIEYSASIFHPPRIF